ncbi:MAG TPA: hypothetical protein VIF64_00445, partial [Pyrinomonadaceae bacterium]
YVSFHTAAFPGKGLNLSTGTGSDRPKTQGGYLILRRSVVSGSSQYIKPRWHWSAGNQACVFGPVATTTPRGLPARGPRSASGTDVERNFHHEFCSLPILKWDASGIEEFPEGKLLKRLKA